MGLDGMTTYLIPYSIEGGNLRWVAFCARMGPSEKLVGAQKARQRGFSKYDSNLKRP